MSERRACRVISQPRSTQRYQPTQPERDRALKSDIHRLAGSELRAGYRTVARLLRREGWVVNTKRVHRIWKAEGLRVTARSVHKKPKGSGKNAVGKLVAEHLNQMWTYDFVHDQTDDGDDGERLKFLPILDEYSRELLGLNVAR